MTTHRPILVAIMLVSLLACRGPNNAGKPKNGSCCTPDKGCVELETAASCSARGGMFNGLGSKCSANPCGTTPPPGGGGARMTLPEWRGRQRTLAAALSPHPADKTLSARGAVTIARGGKAPSLASSDPFSDPSTYWDADIALRLALGACQGCKPDPAAKTWFAAWIRQLTTQGEGRGKPGEGWAQIPAASDNHSWAKAFGAWAAWKVLGPAGYAANGGNLWSTNPTKVLNNHLSGTWTCSPGCTQGKTGTNLPWTGEVRGSRHYGQRSASDMIACADLCDEPERTMAFQANDKVWTFLNGKVREDGVWPEDLIPQIRAERDDLCVWPVVAWQETKYSFLSKHPGGTPGYSYLWLDYVKNVNKDFISNVKPCSDYYCKNKDGCDERIESTNNMGMLIGGQRPDGSTGWTPMKVAR
jgi:hypothetical protein